MINDQASNDNSQSASLDDQIAQMRLLIKNQIRSKAAKYSQMMRESEEFSYDSLDLSRSNKEQISVQGVQK